MTARNNYLGRFRDSGAALSADIKAVGTVVKDAAAEKFNSLKDGAATMTRNTRDAVGNFVSDSPVRALAIAAGAGALLGWFLRRR